MPRGLRHGVGTRGYDTHVRPPKYTSRLGKGTTPPFTGTRDDDHSTRNGSTSSPVERDGTRQSLRRLGVSVEVMFVFHSPFMESGNTLALRRRQ